MESCLPEINKKIQNFIKLQLPTIRTLRNSNEFFVPLRVRIIESLLHFSLQKFFREYLVSEQSKTIFAIIFHVSRMRILSLPKQIL